VECVDSRGIVMVCSSTA